jgi:hypothetical protein
VGTAAATASIKKVTSTALPPSPTDPDIFRAGDAPTCSVVGGHTVVNYSPAFHASFKCSHSGTSCSCDAAHPTSANGGCKEIVHTNGVAIHHAGDCVTQDESSKILDRLADFSNNKGESTEVSYDGHPTAIKMNRCKGGGDAFSNWSFKGKIHLEYDLWAGDSAYLGFSEGFPGQHTWADNNVATSGWQHRTLDFECPYSKCHLMIEDYVGGTCGNVWFDNFVFTSLDGQDAATFAAGY